MRYNSEGRELPDPTPVEIPLDMKRPETVQEMMARMVRTEVSQMAASRGMESFEESFDFDVDDDVELPLTSHELVAMKLEIGQNGEGADADSGDERESGRRKREDRSDSDGDEQHRGFEGDESRSGRRNEARDSERASGNNRRRKSGESDGEDDRPDRGGRTRSSRLDDDK